MKKSTFDSNSPIYFNDMALSNDLSGGGLQGAVLFAQSTVIPSQASALPGDSQPHLASERKTLVLFKTTGGFSASNVHVTVRDGSGQIVTQGDMNNPDALPPAATQIQGLPSQFFAPDSYGVTIDSQAQFNQMLNDTSGAYLASLLQEHQNVKIVTSDGNYTATIYMPDPSSIPDDRLVVFERKATFATAIKYGSESISPDPGQQIGFKIFEKKWVTPGDLSYDAASLKFAIPGYFDEVVSDNKTIRQLGNDPSGAGFLSLLGTCDSLEVRLSDGNYDESFFLPPLPSATEQKTVTFMSTAGYNSLVNYGENGASMVIRKGDARVFKYLDGRWVEWSDTQFAKLRYGDGFWSYALPAANMKPGYTFAFSATNQATGATSSGSYAPSVGAPSELLFHTIDLGLLTTRRDNFPFQQEAKYHEQYFQQVPISRLTVNKYEPVQWNTILLQDGVIYSVASDDEGTVYTGDLRENIAKELIGLGINNANYGVPVSGGGETNPYGSAVAQIVIHNTIGNYRNGAVVQGLSGGAGRATLVSSLGNEFSHELGHNYGLGHFDGGFTGSVHKPAGELNSTWGWDSERNVFIPNFGRGLEEKPACVDGECQRPFNGHTMALDAMAGGEPFYPDINDYTLYTPHSLKKIQSFLEAQAVFDPSSPTGYRKWAPASQTMEPWSQTAEPTSNELDQANLTALINANKVVEISRNDNTFPANLVIPAANSGNNNKGLYFINNIATPMVFTINGGTFTVAGNRATRFQSNGISWNVVDDFNFYAVKKPMQQGVPVTTILGFYDPENDLPSYVYPALYGGYCNIYPASTDAEINSSRCYLEVTNAASQVQRFAFASARITSHLTNRLHVNVPTSFGATKAAVFADGYQITGATFAPPLGTSGYTITGMPV